MSQETQPTEKKARPIVPFLRLDGGKPHLVGTKCGACGALYIGTRVACSKCHAAGQFSEVALSDRGSLYVYSIVHQSLPGIPVPYVSAIVDLEDGLSIRCTLTGVEPDPAKLPFGMPVEMFTQKVREDKDGTDVIAFFFRPRA